MGISCVALSTTDIKTRASRQMTSRNNIKTFDFNGVNVAKHWHVGGGGAIYTIFDPVMHTTIALDEFEDE